MLTDRLQAAVNSAANLPAEEQDKLAAQIESAILNAQWDADLDNPQNDEWLKQWIEEAQQEETLDFPTPST